MSQLLLSICSKVICKIILLFDISSPAAAPPNGSDSLSAGGMNIPNASQISGQKQRILLIALNFKLHVDMNVYNEGYYFVLCTNLVVNV